MDILILREIADIVEPFTVLIVNPHRDDEPFNALELDAVDLTLDEQQALIAVMAILVLQPELGIIVHHLRVLHPLLLGRDELRDVVPAEGTHGDPEMVLEVLIAVDDLAVVETRQHDQLLEVVLVPQSLHLARKEVDLHLLP